MTFKDKLIIGAFILAVCGMIYGLLSFNKQLTDECLEHHSENVCLYERGA